MKFNRSFTLIEIMVVVAIIALLAVLTLPSIKAMQAGGARAQAYNTINAALQAARSYAIMHGINTAARFQPNGKIFLVYRFNGNPNSQYWNWDGSIKNTYPLPNQTLYLPVVDQEPLTIPNGYAVMLDNVSPFWEPLYICYNSQGTLAINEPIRVALDNNGALNEPINPDFNGDGWPAWDNLTWVYSTYVLEKWVNNTTNGADAAHVRDVSDRKLVRYYYIAPDNSSIETICADTDNGPDHYAGCVTNPATLSKLSVSQITMFPTPDGWWELPIFSSSSSVKTRASEMLKLSAAPSNNFDTIFINPYTGRVIRPVE